MSDAARRETGPHCWDARRDGARAASQENRGSRQGGVRESLRQGGFGESLRQGAGGETLRQGAVGERRQGERRGSDGRVGDGPFVGGGGGTPRDAMFCVEPVQEP